MSKKNLNILIFRSTDLNIPDGFAEGKQSFTIFLICYTRTISIFDNNIEQTANTCSLNACNRALIKSSKLSNYGWLY